LVELVRYDIEIERLQNELAEIISERDALAFCAEGCRSLFSPIRRLPTELLTEIFGMCAPYEGLACQLSEYTTP
ncbi:hypothetical protein B0H19DRAFT_913580, partial [Mycena capillaripes]